MGYKDILDILAPCGLNWYRYFANSDGEIKMLSTRLQERLGAFDRYAEANSDG